MYVTDPTDLARLLVVIRCRKSSAPGPLTSSRFRGVMSYMATRCRVAVASAATIQVRPPGYSSTAKMWYARSGSLR